MIQMKMKMMFGMQIDGSNDEEGRDKRNFRLNELQSSDDDEEEEDKQNASGGEDSDGRNENENEQAEQTRVRPSSNYVSTLQDPSFCIESGRGVSDIYVNPMNGDVPNLRQSNVDSEQPEQQDAR